MSMLVRIFKRSIIRLLAVVVVFLNIVFIFHVSRGDLSLESRTVYNVQSMYSNFLLRTLDVKSPFHIKRLTTLLKEKIQNDHEKVFWQFSNNSIPLAAKVPNFDNQIKPTVLPYDPRLTIATYYDRITKYPGEKIKFHWSDWVDMSKLHKHIFQESKFGCDYYNISSDTELIKDSTLLPLTEYCVDDKSHPLGYRITKFFKHQSAENNELLSKAHLFSSFPSPYKVIFLANSGSYSVDVHNWQENSLQNSILNNGYLDELYQSDKTANPKDKYKTLTKKIKPDVQQQIKESVDLDIGMFEFNGTKRYQELKARTNLTLNEQKYVNCLNYSLTTKNPHKFFDEIKLLKSFKNNWLGDHYDWRFFNGIDIGSEESILALHKLIHNFLRFMQTHGLITWVAHGSLLSWYWNGLIFPWDTDLDVQMPISDLHKLGELYNQTLVVENSVDFKGQVSGFGRYFIDVGSSITHRTRGNGNNNIDARFIDVDTGLYVDITGLAVTDQFPPDRYKVDRDEFDEMNTENKTLTNRIVGTFQCRNNHFAKLDEISPLRTALVEGTPALIPGQFLDILNYEYHLAGLTKKNFKSHIYLNNLKLWVSHEAIKEGLYTNQQELFEQILIDRPEQDDYMNLFENNDHVFKEFLATDAFTSYHLVELKALLGEQLSSKEKSIIANYNFRCIRPDLFIASLMKPGWDYDDQLRKLQMLTQIQTRGGNLTQIDESH